MRPRIAILTALIALAWCAPSVAQSRSVTVNGLTMTSEQIALLDSMACTRIPNGRYWLHASGAWGYEGLPVRIGTFGELCRNAPPPRRKSLSERGLLYSPGELLR